MIDPQLKRGLLDSCVLGVLCRGESHGYKIVKDLSACIDISESTLYPILRRLETDGCPDGAQCGAQWPPAQALHHHRAGAPASGQLFGQPGGSDGNLPFCQEAA